MCAAFRPSEPARITSRRNPLVRQLRQLHSASGRREQGLLLIEGTHLAQELVRLDLCPDQLLCSERWLANHSRLLEALQGLRQPPLPCTVVSDEVLAAVATTEHPDGVVLTLRPPAPPAPQSLGFGLVLDGIQDPGNLGTLMRTALAAGIEQIWLAGGADPWQPKVLRASAGAALALSCRRGEPSEVHSWVREAAAQGLQVVATLPPAQGAQPYWELNWRLPTLLLLGAEGPGLSAELQELATARVCIPHSDAVESLNVAVAAAPLLLERQRQERMPVN